MYEAEPSLVEGKVEEMKRFQIIGLALVAVFALTAIVAASASAVEFLLALWLEGGVAVSVAKATDSEGELLLEDEKTLFGKVPVLCSGILDGTVNAASLGTVTELLTLAGVAIPTTVLSGTGLSCTDQSGGLCGSPKVWAENLPWTTEVELMVDGTETFFVTLILNGAYYIVCSSGLEDLCTSPETAVKLTNEAGGLVDNEFTDAFQVLAGLVLGTCNLGGTQSGVVEGLGTQLLTSGVALTVSSE